MEVATVDARKLESLGDHRGIGHAETTSQNVIENLSRPVSVYNIDMIADEMAEIIAKSTIELNIDDNSASSIASFKAVGPSVSAA